MKLYKRGEFPVLSFFPPFFFFCSFLVFINRVDKVVGYGGYFFKGVIVIRLQNDVLQRCMGKHNC